ncbi:hypothetical protein [Limimaricola pyoseonensis]|uniref:Uncharacterized protein n=1 Tax=Limimaricola pyoseonensis TaxID=521013 RepID=A0A1G7CXP6_9RHOB|nr:hypothetical protein [Limimaricola pyoseonensis]SDE44112.1 hypothetical protein SAMN04488567_1689 [Limimaricola pyoseonensis]
MQADFDIVIVAQAGRLEAEALLLAASLRRFSPGFAGRLVVAEPQPGPLWPDDPRLTPEGRDMLVELGATLLPFESRRFGAAYPHGNKIEALAAMPPRPFLFLDSDTLVTAEIGALPLERPSASMRREATWPVPRPGWPGYEAVWRALHERFGLEIEPTLDPARSAEDWQRYLYFNAGWVCGPDARAFGARWGEWACAVLDDPPPALDGQVLHPWLDQAVLPLVVAAFGGGRPGAGLSGLDGPATCHYRTFPLLYARESDAVVAALEEVAAPNQLKRLLKRHEPILRMVYQGRGRRVRALFDRAALPAAEKEIRNILRSHGFWMR